VEGGVTEGYSDLVLELFRRPINRRRVDGANATAEGVNPLCGDRIRMEFVVRDGEIVDAGFTGDACAICVAAASLSMTAATTTPVAELMKMQDEHMLDLLRGQVPKTRRRCATLPLDTMQRALLPFIQPAGVRPIILAAGSGRRFGGDKLVAIVDGEPMIRGVVRSYVALAGRATVVVAPDSKVTSVLGDLPVDCIVNGDAEEGIASSIRAGVASCGDQPAVMIALADEPRVNRALAGEVMKRWQETGAPVVAARFNGEIGHPVIFDRSCFYDLLALRGDIGARRLIRGLGDRVEYVDLSHSHPVDVDTPEDLDNF
jgi:molybdenum cofactor cytidylyltransferase